MYARSLSILDEFSIKVTTLYTYLREIRLSIWIYFKLKAIKIDHCLFMGMALRLFTNTGPSVEALSPPLDPLAAIVGYGDRCRWHSNSAVEFRNSTVLDRDVLFAVPRDLCLFVGVFLRKPVSLLFFIFTSFAFTMHVSLMQKLPMPQVSNFFYPFNTSLEEEIKRLFANFTIETQSTPPPDGKSL